MHLFFLEPFISPPDCQTVVRGFCPPTHRACTLTVWTSEMGKEVPEK